MDENFVPSENDLPPYIESAEWNHIFLDGFSNGEYTVQTSEGRNETAYSIYKELKKRTLDKTQDPEERLAINKSYSNYLSLSNEYSERYPKEFFFNIHAGDKLRIGASPYYAMQIKRVGESEYSLILDGYINKKD